MDLNALTPTPNTLYKYIAAQSTPIIIIILNISLQCCMWYTYTSRRALKSGGYRIARIFRGRKFSRISQIGSFSQKISLRNLTYCRCGQLGFSNSRFFFLRNLTFKQFAKNFSHKNFPLDGTQEPVSTRVRNNYIKTFFKIHNTCTLQARWYQEPIMKECHSTINMHQDYSTHQAITMCICKRISHPHTKLTYYVLCTYFLLTYRHTVYCRAHLVTVDIISVLQADL